VGVVTAHPRDLVTRTIVGEDCYYDGRRVHTLSGDYAEHLADAAVTALVAAGWGDLTAERERLAGLVEGYATDHHSHVPRPTGTCDVYSGDRCDITAAYRYAARLIRETPEETP
jgi:hypothetical protein